MSKKELLQSRPVERRYSENNRIVNVRDRRFQRVKMQAAANLVMPLLVNGELIHDQVIHMEFARLSGELVPRQMSAGEIAQVQDAAAGNVIDRVLLRQLAESRGLRVSASELETERRRRWGGAYNSTCGSAIQDAIVSDMLVERVTMELTRHVPRPSRHYVEQYYAQQAGEFTRPEAVHVLHIVKNIQSAAEEVPARDAMERAEQELDSGAPFARVADQYSDCAGSGGALGWVIRGTMVEEFDEVIFTLGRGQRSPIFRTIFGLHIALVTDRSSAGVEPFATVRPRLARALHRRAQDAHLQQILSGLRRQAEIREVAAPGRETLAEEDVKC